MKKLTLAFFLLTLASSSFAQTEYWFNTGGVRANDFSDKGNWFGNYPGGSGDANRGNLPSDIINAKIKFQTKELDITSPVTLQTSHAFSSDKDVHVYGSTLTLKNMMPTTGENFMVIADVYNTNGKFTIDNDISLASASTAYAATFKIYSSGLAAGNDVILNGNISLANDKIDTAYTRYNDDVLNISCSGKGNTYLNGTIDLTKKTSDTSSSTLRVYVSGIGTNKVQDNSFVYIGGTESNTVSAVKVIASGHVILAKENGAKAATQIELRANSMVTFKYDNQTSSWGQIRAIDARYDIAFGGDVRHAHTAAFLNLNNTNQSALSIAFEWDKWQGGSKAVMAAGTYQYAQFDFGDKASVFNFTDSSKSMDMSANLAIDYDTNLRLETDAAKIANRENAIKSGLILTNFDYAAGDRLYAASDKIILGLEKYYDDISLISKEFIDHIWLAEGEKGVDYEMHFELLEDGRFSLVVNMIPEPATVAAILGALALGLALYRRRA